MKSYNLGNKSFEKDFNDVTTVKIICKRLAVKHNSDKKTVPRVLVMSLLGDLKEKFSRKRSGQSVSLLNHLSKDCYPGTVSCNVFSIKFVAI